MIYHPEDDISFKDGEINGGRTKEHIKKGRTKLEALEGHLVKINEGCSRASNEAGVILKPVGILMMYHKLSLYKTKKHSSPLCDHVNAYFRCLNDKETKKMVKDLSKDADVRASLKYDYNIDDKEVDQIFKFFKKLDKKVN